LARTPFGSCPATCKNCNKCNLKNEIMTISRKIGLCVATVLTLIAGFPSSSHAAQDRKSVYTGVPSLVIQLVRFGKPLDDNGRPIEGLCRTPTGTGFFISTTRTPESLYLVTARHVMENAGELYARVPLVNTQTGNRQLFGLRLKKTDWITHPNEGTESILPIDIVIARLAKLPGVSGAAFTDCEGKCGGGSYDQLGGDDPEPPEDILIYGFPGEIGFRLKEPRPMGRKGIVALSAELGDAPYIKIDGQERLLNSKVFLMDIDMFPGNSGSPVLRFPLHSFVPYLGGVVSATNLQSRYAIGEPVSHVRELLDVAIDHPVAQNTWFTFDKQVFPEPCERKKRLSQP
jgi:hypothetical protein